LLLEQLSESWLMPWNPKQSIRHRLTIA